MNVRIVRMKRRMAQAVTGPRGQSVAQRLLSSAQRWLDFFSGRQHTKPQSQSENGENSLLNREAIGSTGKETK